MLAVVIIGVAVTATLSDIVGIWAAVTGVVLLAMTWMPFLDRWVNERRGRGVIGRGCSLVADDQGLHYEHPLGSGVIAWPALTHVTANDKSMVFGRDRVLAAYVPVTAFASTSDRDEFLAFARAHVTETPR